MKFISNRNCMWRAVVLMAVCALPRVAFAAETVRVENAWARATAPGQTAAGAYMELASDADAVLVGVETPVASKAELHHMSMDGGVMRMRPVTKIELPARKVVKLAPGGYHVMLLEIKKPLKAGDKIPLTLTIRNAGAALSIIKVEAEVRSVDAAAAHGH